MAPIIRAVLTKHLPHAASSIDIIANDVKFTDPEGKGTKGNWELVFRHPDSSFGHDKSKAILPYRDLDDPPVLVFCGDGVSGKSSQRANPLADHIHFADLSAAKHADLLFAKERADGESDLMVYCKRNDIPFVQFQDLYVLPHTLQLPALNASFSHKVTAKVAELLQGKTATTILKEEQ